MGLGEVIPTAVRLYAAAVVPLVLAVLVVFGPLNLLAALPGTGTALLDPFAPAPPPAVLAFAVAVSLLTLIVNPIVMGAVVAIVVRRDRGGEATWQEGYRDVGAHAGSLVGAALLVVLLALVAIAVIAVPALLLGTLAVGLGVVVGLLAVPVLLAVGVLFYLVVPVVVLEGLPAAAAVRRVVALVRPRPWPVIGTVLVAGILIGIVGGVLGFGLQLGGALGGPVGFVLSAAGATLSSLVTVPLTANVALLAYLDARRRQPATGPAPTAGGRDGIG